ncbi:MAG: thioredoxin domain-containing protein [Candidatus Bathyarchaeota archaeon]|nr:thioredoxin domain-containing protein [Candidatus Bathyarchaeota archaeon]
MKKSSEKKQEQIEENIDDVLRSKEKVFVLFYASWCPFSQRFLPIFDEYAKGNPLECMSIMVDYKPDLCEKFSIDYYPTVLLFKKGEVYKRLDATPGAGLTKKQLTELTTNP